MRYPVTIAAVALSIILCLFNSTGYDPHNLFFFMFSPPAWISDVFYDIHATPIVVMYALTIVCYAVIGYVCDRLIAADRKRRRA
ncbi:hypothetical protein [Paenibacillus herberti]|uniref:Uncharacterized protein n=1 Tax=Paenibacillus herberti TaxID=1619309 RepID=A0A229P4R7_9BACL|nr:hypothetical protein [Paenibacillus herberti]OXM16944.1 hypothetical protein CGZ75_09965 [Paenibacillus herberti]SDS00256.1 hypothetical protein SAMN05444162_0524 [Paenibacillaceae bacterium GAS479]